MTRTKPLTVCSACCCWWWWFSYFSGFKWFRPERTARLDLTHVEYKPVVQEQQVGQSSSSKP